MGIAKNVASQKIGFVMVDKTDFATPETGISPTGLIRKDGGASATLSNTVSELTNGFYVVTLAQAETNANLLQFRLHDSGASCATQFLAFHTDRGEASQIHSTLDAVIAGPIASILVDTNATLDNKIDSILEDTKEINSQCDSILADTASITTMQDELTSVLVDTRTLSNATYGLDALETITSDILEALDSVTAGPIASILVDTNATLDNKIDSILEDTKTTLDNKISSILVDTGTDIASQLSSVESAVAGTFAEPGAGAPPAAPTLNQAVNWLYRQWRNKVETTSGTLKLYDDAGTGVLASCALSDDATTFVKGELA